MQTTDDDQVRADAEKSAYEYAWNWFAYHAGQRQAVFRFYLVLSGAVSTAYVGTASATNINLNAISYWFGLILAIISFLFWRLDIRSRTLIKLSESYLKIEEYRLSNILGNENICLAIRADERADVFILKWFTSFRQIYRAIFVMIGVLGLSLFVWGTRSRLQDLF